MRRWASYLGVIPPEAMAAAMGGADVIINNSLSEGLANSLLEAATLGIPILARNNPGNAALVRHGINGLLFDDDEACLHRQPGCSTKNPGGNCRVPTRLTGLKMRPGNWRPFCWRLSAIGQKQK